MSYNPDMVRNLKIRNVFVFVLIGICGFIFGQLILKSITKLTLSDFHVYYYVTKAVMKYGMHPYSNYTPIYPYYFPPASLLIFWPLTKIPFYLSKIIFTLINSALLVTSVYLINKMLIGRIDYRFWLMLLLSLIFYPLKFTFFDGQFNIVMLAIFTIGLYGFYKNKPILGGINLGLGVITKISPAIVLIYGILRKKFNLVMVAGITLLVLSLCAEYFVKKDINYYYVKFIVKDVSSQSAGLGTTDQSFLALVKRYTLDKKMEITSIKKSLISYSAVAFLGITFFIIDLKTKRGKYTLFIDYFILTTVGVIGTGLAWYHQYTTLLLPLFGTGILVFTRFDKKFRMVRFVYIVGVFLVYLSWFINLKSIYFPFVKYGQFIMLYGGILLLIGLYFLKINQNWLLEKDLDLSGNYRTKICGIIFLITLIVGLNPFTLSQVLKEARDESRVKALDYMSGVLRSKKVTFKAEESNSFILSNRVGKGYIRFDKGENSKVLDKMYILYEDPINNLTHNYNFKSTTGKDFELKAKMESNKYRIDYGDNYVVSNLVD